MPERDGGAARSVPMTVVPGIDAIPHGLGHAFIVVGVFDGLHRGHLYLLDRLEREAALRSATATVITFDHHPDEILTGAAPPLLCDPDERLRLLEQAGVDVTVVQHFDLALRMTPFEVFVARIAARVPIAGFLMTPDSAFGHDRGGTPATLAALGATMGFEVVVVPPLELAGRPVRSGEIRMAIAAGDLRGAATLLGRPHGLSGRIMAGSDGRRRLVMPMPVALPPAGEYAVTIEAVPDGPAVEGTLVVRGDGGLETIGGPTGTTAVRVRFG